MSRTFRVEFLVDVGPVEKDGPVTNSIEFVEHVMHSLGAYSVQVYEEAEPLRELLTL